MKKERALCIIVYILTHSSKVYNDCSVQPPQQSQQCVCLLPKSSQIESSCKWEKQKIVFHAKKQEGFIDVQLPHLLTCNITNYEIRLIINKTNAAAKTCHKSFTIMEVLEVWGPNWEPHSKVNYNVSCWSSKSTCVKPNNSIPVVSFDYVFSGCYILQVLNGRKRLYQSLPTIISSKYKMKRLVDEGVVTVVMPKHSKSQEYEIPIRFNSAYFLKPPSIFTTLKENCEKNCLNMILHSTTKVNVKDNYKEYNQTFKRCNIFLNITWNCNYSEDTKEINKSIWYVCTYKGLPAGNYIYEFSLLDEYTRCSEGTIWTDPGNYCTWLWKGIDVEYKPTNTSNFGSTTENEHTQYVIMAVVIIIISLLWFLMHLYKKCCIKYENTSEQEIEFAALEELESPLVTTQEIIIIYARDSKLFMDMVLSFKQLLSSLDKNISVCDINVHNETMCVEPENWIRNKFFKENTKFILILNKCGIKIFENYTLSQKRSQIAYREGNWQDNMFLYAIKQLQYMSTRAINYRNLFVASTTFCNSSVFDHIHPDTRFILPNKIESLLTHIFPVVNDLNNSLFIEFNDCCRKYNEFCEENSDYVNSILKVE